MRTGGIGSGTIGTALRPDHRVISPMAGASLADVAVLAAPVGAGTSEIDQ